MSNTIPTDAEITAGAVELGLIAEGEAVPPRLRAKVAKAVTLARSDDEAAQRSLAAAADFADPLDDVYQALRRKGMDLDTLSRTIAAIAPLLWRDITNGK